MKAWIYTVVIRVTNALGYFQKPRIDAKYKMVSIDLNQMIGVHAYLAMGAQVSWSEINDHNTQQCILTKFSSVII